MKHLVIANKIDSCSCDNEGNIEIYIPSYDIELNCYFSGCFQSMENYFQLGVEKQADLSFWHGKAIETDKRKKQIVPSVVGIYAGDETDEDGDTLYIIESIFTVSFDNELGGYSQPTSVGNWVECTGQFVIDEC